VTSPTGVDLVAALTGAALPSASNVFATINDVVTSNPFNQSLNTTDAPTFSYVTVDDVYAGAIEITSTGLMFPDSSTQSTALPTGTQDGYIIRWNIGTNRWEENPVPNLFDQSLNTTDSVAFASITLGSGASLADDEINLTTGLVIGSAITFPDLTTQESAPVYSPLTGQSGGTGATIHNSNYPDEIQIVIGGVTYAMPARIV